MRRSWCLQKEMLRTAQIYRGLQVSQNVASSLLKGEARISKSPRNGAVPQKLTSTKIDRTFTGGNVRQNVFTCSHVAGLRVGALKAPKEQVTLLAPCFFKHLHIGRYLKRRLDIGCSIT